MPQQLTPDQLAALLEKLDAVCRQAQELSTELRRKMADTRRGDHPAGSNPPSKAEDRPSRRRS